VTATPRPGKSSKARRLGVTEIVEKPYILNEFTSALEPHAVVTLTEPPV